ncbi:MAG: hypothetical protein IJM45_08060 [Clostridia bacterium]|nr:hypothetical protein [Clostridia bacterium]
MKKITGKALALTLALVMVFSCLASTSLAATVDNITFKVQGKGGYLAIGDSIGMGCGSDGYYLGHYHGDYEYRDCEGSYVTQIANAVGCDIPSHSIRDQNSNFYPFCYPGLTTAVALDLYGVDDGYSDYELDYPYYDAMLRYFGTPASIPSTRDEDPHYEEIGEVQHYVEGNCGKCGDIIELTRNAELITIELGMCDIFYRAYRIISNGTLLADFKLDASVLNKAGDIVSTAIRLIKDGFNNFKSQYPLLLETVTKLNPDATILICGAFNLIDDVTLLDETMLPLGDLMNNISEQMNILYQKWAEQYGVIYVDIQNCETYATEKNMALLGEYFEDSLTASHPSQIGHDYMARQFLAALPPVEEHHNIYVDLVRNTSVSKVLINGIPVTNYTVNGYDLNVDYTGRLATNMTIYIDNGDGTTQMQYYDLDYTDGGYVVHRVYQNNDFYELFTRPFKLIKKLFDLIKGLFAK